MLTAVSLKKGKKKKKDIRGNSFLGTKIQDLES